MAAETASFDEAQEQSGRPVDDGPTSGDEVTAERGRLVMAVDDLDGAMAELTALGFRLIEIGPADEPTSAVMAVDGLRIRIHTGPGPGRHDGDDHRPGGPGNPAGLRVELYDRRGRSVPVGGDRLPLLAPVVTPGPTESGVVVPPSVQRLVIGHEAGGDWVTGRAGMRYRDLIPERHGGAFIASHIHVPGSGPVPDFVHHHDIAFQMIFCHRGRVRLVYEDQGEPFEMGPGDCVLQPPGIRHRVLESFDDLHVVEVSSPAVHRTFVDHETTLPTGADAPDRDFGGQRFVRHRAGRRAPAATGRTERMTEPGPADPIVEDVGMAAATGGLADVTVHHVEPGSPDLALGHDAALLLLFVLEGAVTIDGGGIEPERLVSGSSAAVPPTGGHRLFDPAPGTSLLRVAVGDV